MSDAQADLNKPHLLHTATELAVACHAGLQGSRAMGSLCFVRAKLRGSLACCRQSYLGSQRPRFAGYFVSTMGWYGILLFWATWLSR